MAILSDHRRDEGDADSLVHSGRALEKMMLRVFFCSYFPSCWKIFHYQMSENKEALDLCFTIYPPDFMYSWQLSSTSHSYLPCSPRDIRTVHQCIHSFSTVLQKVQNAQHILQGPKEAAVCTTDRWHSCGAFIFLKKQMLFKQLCKWLFHYNSEMLQKSDGEPNLAWRYWRVSRKVPLKK